MRNEPQKEKAWPGMCRYDQNLGVTVHFYRYDVQYLRQCQCGQSLVADPLRKHGKHQAIAKPFFSRGTRC